MKIDRKNLLHWIYLLLSGLNVGVALPFRPFIRNRKRKRVILYGHKLSGNLLAMYRHLQESPEPDIEVAFLTLDPNYHRELSERGESCLLATSPRSIPWLATADAVISDHGLHALLPMLFLSNMKFFDVWHGIPFKGFDADDFRVQHRYDEVWVASPSQRALYIERFGFDPQIVHATGYARTDRLVRRDGDIDAIKRGLGLDPTTCGKLVLFAPTWKQDAGERSLFPFGLDAESFLLALSEMAARTDAIVLLRTHLNSSDLTNAFPLPDRIVSMPYARFPDTEAILLVSDILICDWSSIAFDYLLLDRPTIFLDVEAPFAKGLSLDASHRFGAIAGNMDEFLRLLERYLFEPERYLQEFAGKCARIEARVYADAADGDATARCVERLRHWLDRDESSR